MILRAVIALAGLSLIFGLWAHHQSIKSQLEAAEANYSTCQALNAEHKAQINEINEQAERDIAAAERQAMLAEDARRAALAHSARIEAQLSDERSRLSAVPVDNCIDHHAPDDVDRLFRARADDQDRDGHQDG